MNQNKNISKLVFAVLLISATILSACSAQNTATSTGNNALANGTIGVVSSITVTDQIETTGNLDANQLANLNWKTSGIGPRPSLWHSRVLQSRNALLIRCGGVA